MSQFRKEFFLWKRESNSSILEKKKFHLILMQILDIIGGIMVSVFTLSAVYHGFEPKASQTKDYKIGICCFSADCCFIEARGSPCRQATMALKSNQVHQLLPSP
jgi:hypothetical protein